MGCKNNTCKAIQVRPSYALLATPLLKSDCCWKTPPGRLLSNSDSHFRRQTTIFKLPFSKTNSHFRKQTPIFNKTNADFEVKLRSPFKASVSVVVQFLFHFVLGYGNFMIVNLEQTEIKFKPRLKLNHNLMCTQMLGNSCFKLKWTWDCLSLSFRVIAESCCRVWLYTHTICDGEDTLPSGEGLRMWKRWGCSSYCLGE